MRKIVNRCLAFLMIAMVLVLAIPMEKVAAASRARIVISGYSITNDNVIPGEDTEITFTVTNATNSIDATGIFLTVNFEEDALYPVYGQSNQLYINSLKAGESAQVTMPLKTSDGIEKDTVKCEVTIAFSDEEAAEVYYTSTLFLPVTEESRLQVANYSVSDKAYVNTKTRVSASYSNNGKSEISNVVLHVSGIDGMSEEVFNLGNLSGGESNFGEAYVTFGNTGEQNVTVYLSYTDADGNEMKTAEKSYSISVTKAIKNETDSNQTDAIDQTTGMNMNLIITLVLIVLIIAVGIIVWVLWKKRKE